MFSEIFWYDYNNKDEYVQVSTEHTTEVHAQWIDHMAFGSFIAFNAHFVLRGSVYVYLLGFTYYLVLLYLFT